MRKLFAIAIIIALITLIASVFAQDSINPGQNLIVVLSPDDPQPAVTFQAAAGQTVEILVFSVSPGVAPQAQVVDPGGIVIARESNQSSASNVTFPVTFSQDGAHQIQLSSPGNVSGQFVLSVQESAIALSLPASLTPGQTIQDIVDSVNPAREYVFEASESVALVLELRGESANDTPTMILDNILTDETVALISGEIPRIRVDIPAGSARYRITARFDNQAPREPYTIRLLDAASSEEITDVCVATPSGNIGVNVRRNPGTGAVIVGQLPVGAEVEVIGQLPNGSWFQVDFNNLSAWVAGSVVALQGNCESLPFVNAAIIAPPPPPATPAEPIPSPETTPEATAEPTEEVTVEPTEEVTVEPTEEATAEPTEEATAEPTEEVTAEPTEEVPGDDDNGA